MIFDKGTSCIGLFLLTCFGSQVVFPASQPASQPANHTSFLKLPTNFLSTLSSLKQGHAIFQLGGYWGIQGHSQQVNIDDLIGDYITVANTSGSNGLVGAGYFIDGQDARRFKMNYGINWFYLPSTRVNGTVTQENLFTNLSYSYHVTHYPLYVVAKSTINTKSPNHSITLDAGIGPNFMTTSNYQESSLDGITLPDQIFSGKTTTTFSVTTGLGVQFKNFFGPAPLECGYRFFYLGRGSFNVLTQQVVNPLNTGNVYANALMCSITV